MIPTNWYLLGQSKTLAPKDIRRVVIDDSPWALFRTASGQISAIRDRCVHRHAPLSAGRVCGEFLECRYHGWRYAGDGQLAKVPALESEGVPNCKLDALHIKETQGFIWATLSNTSSSPPQFAHFDESGWTSFVMESSFTASVEACLENFLDCPHATFVHRYWFRAPTASAVRAVVRSLPDGAEAEYFNEPRDRSLVWAFLSPRRGPMRHIDRYIAPSTSRVDYEFPSGLAYVITSHCTPTGKNKTAVTTVISFKSRWGWAVKLFFAPLARRILQQDIEMLKFQAQNSVDQCFPPAISTPADLLGPAIWRWRRALDEKREPAPVEDKHVTLYL